MSEPHIYSLSAEESVAVSALDGPARVMHFVKRVADWQSVWGLCNEEGWVSAPDGPGGQGLPVWPHPAYASACAHGAWAGHRPAPVEVHAFAEVWLTDLADQGARVVVFPTPDQPGVAMEAAVLQALLERELSQYE